MSWLLTDSLSTFTTEINRKTFGTMMYYWAQQNTERARFIWDIPFVRWQAAWASRKSWK
jgi:hypothetical protein